MRGFSFEQYVSRRAPTRMSSGFAFVSTDVLRRCTRSMAQFVKVCLGFALELVELKADA